jgi:hypothetical protein
MRLKSLLKQLRLKFRSKQLVIENSQRKPHWSFLPLWVVANAIAYSVGGIISFFVNDYVSGDFGIFLTFAVMSIAIALAQWLVIKSQILGWGWLVMTWVGGSFGGFFGSWASFQVAVTYGDAVDFLAIYGCLRGFTTGLAQWTILRKRFKLADWWIVWTTFSWYICIAIGSLLMHKLGYFLTFFVGGIYGLLTGMGLLLLFWSKLK